MHGKDDLLHGFLFFYSIAGIRPFAKHNSHIREKSDHPQYKCCAELQKRQRGGGSVTAHRAACSLFRERRDQDPSAYAPAYSAMALYKSVTIWDLVQSLFVPNKPPPMPLVMPFCSAHFTAAA